MTKYNLKNLVKNVIKDKYSQENKWVNFELFEELNISIHDLYGINGDKNELIRSYFIASHICTDTEVGINAYFLGEELICITKQAGRKMDEVIIGWASEEIALKTKNYIEKLLETEEPELSLDILDMDLDMGEGYYIEYTGQSISNKVIYKNVICNVIKDVNNNYTNFHNIEILFDGNTITVDIRDCLSPYRIEDNKNMFRS